MTGPIGYDQWVTYCQSYDLSRKGRTDERRPKAKPEREGQPTTTHIGFTKEPVRNILESYFQIKEGN